MRINIKVLDMPEKVGEMVTLNEDGSYTVFLNAKHSYEKQRDSYIHALQHIQNDDFYSELTAEEIESKYD